VWFPIGPGGGQLRRSRRPTRAGLRDYNSARYEVAAGEFHHVLTYYPQDDLAGNAQFYLGEIALQAERLPGRSRPTTCTGELQRQPQGRRSQLHKGLALINSGKRDSGSRVAGADPASSAKAGGTQARAKTQRAGHFELWPRHRRRTWGQHRAEQRCGVPNGVSSQPDPSSRPCAKCARFCIFISTLFATIEVEEKSKCGLGRKPKAPKAIRFRSERFRTPKRPFRTIYICGTRIHIRIIFSSLQGELQVEMGTLPPYCETVKL